MKKIFIILILFLIGYCLIEKGSAYEIPENAIRLRVVANSNSEDDQNIKMKVSKKVQERLFKLLENVKGHNDAKDIIEQNIKLIEYDIKELLNKENYNLDYKVEYGMNYFPKKQYKGVEYNEGEYESLLVTLGTGEGKNWWCILFPPLCLIESEDTTEVEYTFFVKEMVQKYL